MDYEIKKASVRRRKIYIEGNIDKESMQKVIKLLEIIVELDNTLEIPMRDRLPITISISSDGGYVDDGLALVSKILHLQEIGYTINTHAVGMVASMAFIIFVVGSSRLADRYSSLMYHQIWYTASGNINDIETQRDFSIRLQDILRNIVIEHSNLELEELKSFEDNDKYFSIEECLEYGLVDKVI